MTSSVNVRPYVAEDWDGVLALFHRHLGDWSARRWARRWHWQYREDHGCSDCTSYIQVAEADDGTIVGHHGAFPLPLRLNGRRLEVLCPGDFVIDPKQRWAAFAMLKNLMARGRIVLGTGWSPAAAKLFRFYGAVVLPLSEQRYVYQLRYRGATHRELRQRLPVSLHWMANRWAATVLAPVLDRRRARRSKRLPPLVPNGELRTMSSFGPEYDELWRFASRQFEVCLDKNASYLNWRYLHSPIMSPLCLGYYDKKNQLAGVVIACRRAHRDVTRNACGEDGEIVELVVREPDAQIIRQMVIAAMQALDRKKVDAIAATGLHVRLHPVLEEIGFERTECAWGTLFAISNIPDCPASAFMQDEIWYFSSGDGDHLFDQGV